MRGHVSPAQLDRGAVHLPLRACGQAPHHLPAGSKTCCGAQCNDAGFEPDILCKSDDARTAIMWADAGLGVAIVPQSALSILPGKHLVHKTIECPALVTRIAAIRMKNRFLPAAAQSLLQCFEQE